MKPCHLAHLCLFCLSWLSLLASRAGSESSSPSEVEQLLRKAHETRSKVVRGLFEYEATAAPGHHPATKGWPITRAYYRIILDNDKIWCEVRHIHKPINEAAHPQHGEEAEDRQGVRSSEGFHDSSGEVILWERYALDGRNLYYSPNRRKGSVINPDIPFGPGGQEMRATYRYFHPAILGLTPLLTSTTTPDILIPWHRNPAIRLVGEETVEGHQTKVVSLTISEGSSAKCELLYWVAVEPPHPIIRHRVIYSKGRYCNIDCEYWNDIQSRPLPRKVTARDYSPDHMLVAHKEIVERKAEYDYQPTGDLFSFAGLGLEVGAELMDARTRNPIILGRWEGSEVQTVPAVVPSRFPWLYVLASAFLALIIGGSIAFLLYRRRLIARRSVP